MKALSKLEKQLTSILIGAEELIEMLDPHEKNKKLGKLYKYIHGHNPIHKCYESHLDWRLEFKDLEKIITEKCQK